MSHNVSVKQVLVAAGILALLGYLAFSGRSGDISDVQILTSSTGTVHGFEFNHCGGCNLNGRCFFGKCMCYPGSDGQFCEKGTPRDCTKILSQNERLTCYKSVKYGVTYVDMKTWLEAQAAEIDAWSGMGSDSTNDRSQDHINGFDKFAILPSGVNLGHYAEFGCGPYTQTLPALHVSRPDVLFKSVTLIDPGLAEYVAKVAGCPYKTKKLFTKAELVNVPVILVSTGAEVPLFDETFDSILMTNVLEHVLNSYDVLVNLWRALKPGGVLIFNDRWWDDFVVETSSGLDNTYHPIRPKKPVLTTFLDQFETIYRNDIFMWPGVHQHTSVYFIGRKPLNASIEHSFVRPGLGPFPQRLVWRSDSEIKIGAN